MPFYTVRIFKHPEKVEYNKTLTIKVSGLHCYGCNKKVETSFSKVKGIHNVNADFIKKEVKMDFDENTVNLEKIRNTITKAGYIPGVEQID